MYVNCCMCMRAHDLESRQHCECFCLFVCIKKYIQSHVKALSAQNSVVIISLWVITLFFESVLRLPIHSMHDRELESESRKRACVQKRIQIPCIRILMAPWCHMKLELSLFYLIFPRSKINSVNMASSR